MIVTVNSKSTPEEIAIALQKLQKAYSKEGKKHFDALKYCGVIKLTEDPIAIQKALRNEWK